MKFTVLVTGGGAPGIAGTIYSLKNNQDNAIVRIICTDIKENVVGKYLSDAFYCIPDPENDDYIDALKGIITKEKVDVIIPQTTREIAVLSLKQSKFKNVPIIVSSSISIERSNDKYKILKTAEEIGVPYPDYVLTRSEQSLKRAVEKLGYPEKKVVIKPRVSNGMRGVRVLTDKGWDVDRFLNNKPDGLEINLEQLIAILRRGSWPELLVTEYLPGDEYTVDIYNQGKDYIVIPRLRKTIRSGITFDAYVDLRKDLIDSSILLAQKLDLKYCFGFQFKLDFNGVPKLLECNPRVQGTMVMSSFAGFNMIFNSIKQAKGELVDVKKINIHKVHFSRYWGGVGVYDDKVIGKI